MRWCGVPAVAHRFGDAVVVRLPANVAADEPKLPNGGDTRQKYASSVL